MPNTYQPHDLLFVSAIDNVGQPFAGFHQDALKTRPVVVRRAPPEGDWIAVGVRGKTRSERFATKVLPQNVLRRVTPEQLVDEKSWRQSNRHELDKHWQSLTRINAFMQQYHIRWDIVGSLGFELATGITTATADSDIDLHIRCDTPPSQALLQRIHDELSQLSLRTDVQIESPMGGFALNEWLSEKTVLVKTDYAPVISDNPWQ